MKEAACLSRYFQFKKKKTKKQKTHQSTTLPRAYILMIGHSFVVVRVGLLCGCLKHGKYLGKKANSSNGSYTSSVRS